MFQILQVLLMIFATALILYGLWEMRRGWLISRSGGSGAPKVAAGVSKVLNGVAAWVLIAVYTGADWGLGDGGAAAALVAYLALLGLSLYIRRRFGQPAASSEAHRLRP
ncbi:hypothetical protein EV385_0931 [Krasilnikovia cinnamomea]|uniref:Uncharacterized protein n=1 Tax=Krasilnikovia cinnamomea TaxID=349313 RepID=A0A4Q7ZGD8_9ACTN|nr:hypothetical protein [Krasilnikovia cinnamomea]RZU49195.1 hypothetical protein EV385_0931 [Krasilnikovia cinnamomea]